MHRWQSHKDVAPLFFLFLSAPFLPFLTGNDMDNQGHLRMGFPSKTKFTPICPRHYSYLSVLDAIGTLASQPDRRRQFLRRRPAAGSGDHGTAVLGTAGLAAAHQRGLHPRPLRVPGAGAEVLCQQTLWRMFLWWFG